MISFGKPVKAVPFFFVVPPCPPRRSSGIKATEYPTDEPIQARQCSSYSEDGFCGRAHFFTSNALRNWLLLERQREKQPELTPLLEH